MSHFNLRKKPRISYCDYEEPNLDEYVYCSKCTDFAYEYCSIHGPLLVIPDDKVPTKPKVPSFVPRAALTIPQEFLHIAPSIIPGAGLGIFSSMTLPADVRFGPYRGQLTKDVDSMYCWMLHDGNNKWSHAIDAADANSSNWMRYVNCARHYWEQNLVAYQYQGQIYYRTIKIIPRFTELMVFYGGEFAQLLGINLRLYNEPDGFAQVYASSILAKGEDTNIKQEEHQNEPIIENKANKEENNLVKINNKAIQRNVDIKVKKEHVLTLSTNGTVNSYICDICERQFNLKCNLELHIKEHYGRNLHHTSKLPLKDKDKPFRCDTCNKKFAQRYQLKAHYRIHTKEKPYECVICKKRFTQIGNLKQHYHIHTKEKPYECEICKKRFTRNDHLKVHYRIHTKEKPYKCNVCSKAFSGSSDLKTHYRTHTKEKPYTCEICKKRFSQNGHLKTHYRIHTKEKPYKCNVCSKAFSGSSNFKRHHRLIHTEATLTSK